MKRQSTVIRKYTGANPFVSSQAKTYGDEKVVKEFFPISLYWSLFNEQNEILLGTRGSGKTSVLRMLSYSCLRDFDNEQARKIFKSKEYIGFFIPMHLEWIQDIKARSGGVPFAETYEYFFFAFNCRAAISFLQELSKLVADLNPIVEHRLLRESIIVKKISKL